jgi:hypothetical protein
MKTRVTQDQPPEKPTRSGGSPMSASVESSKAGKLTSEYRVAKLFGLKGESWMRHANPVRRMRFRSSAWR